MADRPPGNLVLLELSRVHPTYAGLPWDRLLGHLRIDMTYDASPEQVIAITHVLGGSSAGGRQAPVQGELLPEQVDVDPKVVPRPRIVSELGEEVEDLDRELQLPLISVLRPRKE